MMTANYRFTKQQRLLTPADFYGAFNQTSFKIHQSHLMLFVHIQADKGQEHPRLGLAITKKKLKHAHERNRLKRLARECFRQQDFMKSDEGLMAFDVVLIAKQSTEGLTNAQITQQLNQAFYLLKQRWVKIQTSVV